MAVGLATTTLAHKWLDLLRGVAFTAPTALYVKLHTSVGDPGAAGTANSSAVTTRVLTSFSAATGTTSSSIALGGANSAPQWTMTATENIQFISVWDTIGPTGGNFLWSAQLSTTKSVASGDTLTLTTCGLSLSPVAAT
jgi:hypothetical protein